MILAVTYLRRRARKIERELQAAIDEDRDFEGTSTASLELLRRYQVPNWAQGVRVEHAGPFQWAVVATWEKGH